MKTSIRISMPCKHLLLLLVVLAYAAIGRTQSYTSYFTGNSTDLVINGNGGVCLMGGAGEHDEAMRWFLQQANGGDILVLRASGSDGYNDYLYSELGDYVNSVETIVCDEPASGNDPYIVQKAQQAEAIWFAGGDQWDYISYWRGTLLDAAIRSGIDDRGVVVGGISAGMAIQGSTYFTAQNGTISSFQATQNPYHFALTLADDTFISNPLMDGIIADTHFDNPDRRGRLVSFLARALVDNGQTLLGIACDEYTAVCIDINGQCSVYGEWPTYDEHVYFITSNCTIADNMPEVCTSSSPLTWSHNQQAVLVCKIPGTMNGSNGYSLTTRLPSGSAMWEYWHITEGTFGTSPASSMACAPTSIHETSTSNPLLLYPNPGGEMLQLTWPEGATLVKIHDMEGRECLQYKYNHTPTSSIPTPMLASGVYVIATDNGWRSYWVKQ
jgi:cyanophycinase-like exopeptidase